MRRTYLKTHAITDAENRKTASPGRKNELKKRREMIFKIYDLKTGCIFSFKNYRKNKKSRQ